MAETAMVVAVPGHVLVRSIEDELVLLNLDTDRYFSLNEIGLRFIEALDGQRSVGSISLELGEMYEVDPSVLSRDLLDLVGRLVDEGLVTAVP